MEGKSRMPLAVMAMGILFNVINVTLLAACFFSCALPGNVPSPRLLDYHRSVAAGGGMTTVAYAADPDASSRSSHGNLFIVGRGGGQAYRYVECKRAGGEVIREVSSSCAKAGVVGAYGGNCGKVVVGYTKRNRPNPLKEVGLFIYRNVLYYTRCAISSSRSPANRSITGTSIMV